MLRGAPCCPFYMGTGECAFRNNCRYHHPMHAFHPECVLAGTLPSVACGAGRAALGTILLAFQRACISIVRIPI